MAFYCGADRPTDFLPGVPDWSTLHKPSGQLDPPVKNKNEWQNYRLTADQVAQFWRDGYLLNIPVLTEEQCDRILNDYSYFLNKDQQHPGMDMLYEYHHNQSGDPDNVLMHGLGQWRLTKLFHDLVFHPKIVVHIALDDQSPENGALHYIPGSHRWTRNGEPLPVTDFNFGDMKSIQTVLTEEEKAAFKPVCGKLRKGEASLHHALSVHGSYENRSERPRRATVLNYFGDGVYSNSDEELLKNTGIIPKGQKMDGQFHPLVYDPQWSV